MHVALQEDATEILSGEGCPGPGQQGLVGRRMEGISYGVGVGSK